MIRRDIVLQSVRSRGDRLLGASEPLHSGHVSLQLVHNRVRLHCGLLVIPGPCVEYGISAKGGLGKKLVISYEYNANPSDPDFVVNRSV